MYGWQLAVLFAMIAVFFICCPILVYLLIRYGKWGHSKARAVGSEQSVSFHFLDLHGKRHMVDHISSVFTPEELYEFVAHVCQEADTSSLAFYSTGDDVHPINVSRLLLRDESFNQRMASTRTSPLLLGRLNRNTRLASGPPQAVELVSQSQRENLHSVSYGPQSKSEPLQGMNDSAVASSYQPSKNARKRKVKSNSKGPLPDSEVYPQLLPTLLPTRDHINVNTPIYIYSSIYYVQEVDQSFTPLDSHATLAVDRAFFGEANALHRTAIPEEGAFAGSHFVVTEGCPSTITVRTSGKLDRTVLRREGGQIVYTVEQSSTPLWIHYQKPFCLPLGQWCVRSKTLLNVEGGSSSRVYVVSA